MEEPKEKEFTWRDLKEFANSLPEEHMDNRVIVAMSDDEVSITINSAFQLEENRYWFEDDDEYTIGESDFEKTYHFDGKYKTFEEALENEKHTLGAPVGTPYLCDI